MKVLISGSSGLIGTPLVAALREKGHTVVRLVRKKLDEPDTVYWKPSENEIDRDHLKGFDAVIHLAGESIAEGRWNDEKKQAIRDSRINGTVLLADAVASLDDPPKAFLCGSAMGFYGTNRGDEKLTESAGPGKGFLADVTTGWEASASAAIEKGLRTAFLRTSVVLSDKGGALPLMVKPFKMGMGGKLGSGQQYMSWISLDDEVRAIVFVLEHEGISGPVNLCSPNPVTNEKLTDTLAEVLNRPAAFKVPEFMLKMAVGDMADEMLLASIRQIPQKLLDNGFEYNDPELKPTLEKLLAS